MGTQVSYKKKSVLRNLVSSKLPISLSNYENDVVSSRLTAESQRTLSTSISGIVVVVVLYGSTIRFSRIVPVSAREGGAKL